VDAKPFDRYRLSMSEQLIIARMGHRGDGVADTQAGAVYVPYTLPGETVEAEVKGDRATVGSIARPSAERIEPICPHFGVCGGCAVQHWRADRYREWKRSLVTTALDQAGLQAEVAELVDAHGEGRRRCVLHAKRGGRKVLSVGYTGRRSHIVVPIDLCPILAPPLARAIAIAWRLAEPLEPSGKPLDLQFSATDGGLDVDIRGSGELRREATEALARIARAEKLARVTRHGELVAQFAEPSVAMGRARVVLPPGGFLQATAAGEAALVDIVREALGEARRIADLYCGIGTFTLRLAEFAQVLAADSDAAAVAALTQAAKAPGLKPIEAIARDLHRSPLTAGELVPCKAAVLDPPRQGAEAQARELCHAGIARVVYVSCNPASFARDARILVDGGFRFGRVVPVDQFRYSAHVELVGVFER
jgi:23S rRNA (uracil1939-C5)-methyltransferase